VPENVAGNWGNGTGTASVASTDSGCQKTKAINAPTQSFSNMGIYSSKFVDF
jgi:hypothetical protein